MDPLAHTLVGGMLAETGLKRGSRLATPTLLIGANMPDVDIVASFLGRDASLLYRRGHTHGVLAMVVLPVALTLLMLGYDRLRRRFRPELPPARPGFLLLLATLSTLSHPLLDWMNTYGVRLLMPFDGRWFYGDALFIVDPWMWLLAGSAVVLARSARATSRVGWGVLALATTALVTVSAYAPWPAKLLWGVGVTAIVIARTRSFSRQTIERVARTAGITLAAYCAAMVAGSQLARIRVADHLRAQGSPAETVMAGPVAANPFEREVIAVGPWGYRFFFVRWPHGPTVSESGPAMPGDVRDEVVAAALDARAIRGMRNWLRLPSYEVKAEADGYRVRIYDVRYSRAGASIGQAEVYLDKQLQPR